MIDFEINNTTDFKIYKGWIKLKTKDFSKILKINKKSVSMAIVSDPEIQKLNNIYRGINAPTDVLSFAEKDSKNATFMNLDKDYLGEIIISFDTLKKQAKEAKISLKKELINLLIHGLLHLLGHDHKTKNQTESMLKIEQELLKSIKW